ncbi:MAG: ChbG/HpnK family deacetylase [Polyangiaceae bacterium]
MDLVITADDLGIDARRDDGIFEALAAGAVTQASLLVAGPSGRTAAERVRREGWSVGLHLDLTETPAVAADVPSLVDARGRKLGKHGLRRAIARGAVDVTHVAREAEAQIALFSSRIGRPPVHVDGHQHVHVLPELTETLASVFRDAGVKSTRIPEQSPVDAEPFYRRVSEDAHAARTVYARQGIASTEAFVGLDRMGAASDGERLAEAVRAHAVLRSVEVMTHPGHVGSGWDDFNESPVREHELAVLLARPFAKLVAGGVASLSSFRTLAGRA